jgi:hypothetical protein
MSSTIYDNDCSIIKKPVTSDEFRKEIDLLKEEIANLKNEVLKINLSPASIDISKL